MNTNTAHLSNWLALIIGNSRFHWAWFQREILQETWDSQHFSIENENLLKEILPVRLTTQSFSQLPLYIASVVPQQSVAWKTDPNRQLITLNQIPLAGIYPTMGVDRALAVLGAGITWGFPCLVIDAGTALTFTGASGEHTLVGGAILPGLRLQLQSLATQTAALPEVNLSQKLPSRWAISTPEAIASGVIYTVLAGIKNFIEDWKQQFPSSQIVLTGGDANLLLNYLQIQLPTIAERLVIEPNLIFLGMRSLVLSQSEINN